MHRGNGPVSLKDISRRQQIPLSYLEHIITPLIAARILRSSKGPKGGIILAKNPAEIKLSQVINLLEGSMAPVECVDNPQACSRSATCVTRDLWGEIKKATDSVLESVTLQDLCERQKLKEQPETATYDI
jgi:Rrf2 family protein